MDIIALGSIDIQGSFRKRFTRWAQAGAWERVFNNLIDDPDNDYVSPDSTLVRSHRQAATGKGGGQKRGTRLWGVPEEDCPPKSTGQLMGADVHCN